MSMETFICPKCKRQGCWTEEGEFDYVCKCGHSVQVEPQLTDLSKSDLIAKIYTTENQRDRLAMRCAELESAITEAVDAAVAPKDKRVKELEAAVEAYRKRLGEARNDARELPLELFDGPNPECRTVLTEANCYSTNLGGAGDYFVGCHTCHYRGPQANYPAGPAEAIRLHNAICRQPTPEAADNETVKQLVNKFLAWPLPESVCPDLCTNVTREQYPHPRIGTMLLTAIEAEQMIRYLGLYPCPCHPAAKQGIRSHEVELRCSHLNGCNNIMDELKEHTHAAQGEDAYLRIYPCDARKILEAAHPPKPEPTEASEPNQLEKWAAFVVRTLKAAGPGSLGATGPKDNRHSMVLEILKRYDELPAKQYWKLT